MSEENKTAAAPAETVERAPAAAPSFRDRLHTAHKRAQNLHSKGAGWVDQALELCTAAAEALPEDDRYFVEALKENRESGERRARMLDVGTINRLAHAAERALAVYRAQSIEGVTHHGPRLEHVQRSTRPE